MENTKIYNEEILRSKHLSKLLKGDLQGPITGYPHIDMPNLKQFDQDVLDYVYNDIDKKSVDNIYDLNKNELDKTALSYFGKDITYKEMFEEIDKFAKAFKQYGIEKGDYVSVCLPNVPEVVYIKYALNKIGATASLIDPRVNAEGILDRTDLVNAKLLVTVTSIYPKIDEIIDKLDVENIIMVSPNSSLNYDLKNPKGSLVKGVFDIKNAQFYLHEQLEKQRDRFLDVNKFKKLSKKHTGNYVAPYDEDIPFSIVYTSGTTGSMKGVKLSNVAYNVSNKQLNTATHNFNRNKKVLGIIPFFSSYGSIAGMNNSLANGWQVDLLPTFNPEEFVQLLEKYQPNVCIYVPNGWQKIIGTHTDLSFLDNPVSGGDVYLPSRQEQTNKSLKDNNCDVRVCIGYGDSEHAGPVSKSIENEYYTIGSAGVLLPGNVGMVIDRETGKPLKYNEKGEICVSSKTMMQGYFNNKEETDKITLYDEFGRKYYRSEDEGYIDENGNIYIIGRYKRAMMRPDGHTVHATPIENVIESHDKVNHAVVVGLKKKTEEDGSIITAFVSLKDKDANFEEIVDELEEISFKKLSEREKAMAYVEVDQIKFNNMGKADYKEYQKYYFDDVDAIITDYTFLNEYKKGKTRTKKK